MAHNLKIQNLDYMRLCVAITGQDMEVSASNTDRQTIVGVENVKRRQDFIYSVI